MAKGISLSIAADAKQFQSGIKSGVIAPLDDASDALKDLAKDGDRAVDKLEDSMRDARKDTERLGDEYEQLNRKIREAGGGGRKFSGDVKQSTTAAGAAVREFGDEAKQNMAETFSSFDGSATSFADGIQGTFGGIVSSMGPIGMAAGAAGALGVGMLITAFEEAEEDAQAFRERVAELTTELIDAGEKGELSLGYIVDKLKEMATEAEDGELSLDGLSDAAAKGGRNFEKLAQAFAGNIDGIDDLIAAEQEYGRELVKTMDINEIGGGAFNSLSDEKVEAQKRILDGLIEVRDAEVQAQAEYEAFIRAGGAALEARSEAMDTLQGELDESIGVWDEYKDAETGALDPAGYLAAMEARMSATANFNTNVQTIAAQFGLSFEETQAILDQGVDFAPMLQSIIDAGLGEQFAGQVQAAVGGGQEIIDGTPLGATVTVDAETGTAQAQLDETAEARETTVEAIPEVSRAQRALDEVATKNRTATITAVANTATASNAIDRLVEDRLVTIRTRVLDPRGVEVP